MGKCNQDNFPTQDWYNGHSNKSPDNCLCINNDKIILHGNIDKLDYFETQLQILDWLSLDLWSSSEGFNNFISSNTITLYFLNTYFNADSKGLTSYTQIANSFKLVPGKNVKKIIEVAPINVYYQGGSREIGFQTADVYDDDE